MLQAQVQVQEQFRSMLSGQSSALAMTQLHCWVTKN
jgi:hypothetical protein